MLDVLMRAGCFVAIIVLGYVLRRVNFFEEGDFTVLSKIVLKITLPAAIVSSFAGKDIDLAMLLLLLIGLFGGILYMFLGYMMTLKKSKADQAFEILNLSGYNIGNFTLPFVQSFLGPVGVITASIFDIGNACVCLGGAYSVASIVKSGGKFSPKRILKSILKSVAFDCYIIMIVMKVFSIPMPQIVISFADIIGGANAFMAMLMLGVGFKLSTDKSNIGHIARIIVVRYAIAIAIACACFFLLPVSLEIRQALVILALSPIASANPPFTAELKGDVGLSSAVNSISIICSIVLIVSVLLVML